MVSTERGPRAAGNFLVPYHVLTGNPADGETRCIVKLVQLLVASLLLVGLCCASPGRAQDPAQQEAPPHDAMQGPGAEGRQRPMGGKISAIHGSTLMIERMNGETTTVKVSDKTEFRKDREAANLSDFKVGDLVMVRGEAAADGSVEAQLIATRSGGLQGGGPGGGRGGPMGTLGKDFVVGEVKAIDAPKLTVLRVDNVTQTLELNEETSLRKGRESITMADIQVGDHIMARGALQNDAFVPKGLTVFSPEQWKRMQEMGFIRTGPAGDSGASGDKKSAPEGATPQAKPQEQPN
jgi:hypothetical protein